MRIEWGADALALVIVDDGRGGAALVSASAGGQGVAGMRERVRLHGGRLHAGPVGGGGYRVEASLPYEQRGAER